MKSSGSRDPVPAPRGILAASSFDPAHGELVRARALPSPELAPFVHHYWSVQWELRVPFRADTLPHPAARIELEERDGRVRGADVVGVRTGRFAKSLRGRGQYFGVQFRVAAFQPLWRGNMASITDRVLPIAQVFGPDANEWARALLGMSTSDAKFELADRFLKTKLRPMPAAVARTRDLVERIASDRRLCSVDDLARACGDDVRTLQRRFQRYVGVHPKWVIQRYRLLEAAAQLTAADPPKLASLAAALGYADQAHFQRDFRVVTGRTPGSFARP